MCVSKLLEFELFPQCVVYIIVKQLVLLQFYIQMCTHVV